MELTINDKLSVLSGPTDDLLNIIDITKSRYFSKLNIGFYPLETIFNMFLNDNNIWSQTKLDNFWYFVDKYHASIKQHYISRFKKIYRLYNEGDYDKLANHTSSFTLDDYFQCFKNGELDLLILVCIKKITNVDDYHRLDRFIMNEVDFVRDPAIDIEMKKLAGLLQIKDPTFFQSVYSYFFG